MEAATDADGRGNEAKGFAVRGAHAASGIVYGGLAISAVAMALGRGGALEALREQPGGAVLLGATAIGLASFGLFGLVQARYRRLDAPDLRDAVPDGLRKA